jgi:type 2 lantibiotic biosynthesis protein LanM
MGQGPELPEFQAPVPIFKKGFQEILTMEAHALWQRTAADAASLYERIGDPVWRAGEGAPETGDTEGLLARWCDAAALGNWDLLDRRLAWDGLRRDEAGRWLGAGEWTTRPRWVETLEAILARCGPAYARVLTPTPLPRERGSEESVSAFLSLSPWEREPEGEDSRACLPIRDISTIPFFPILLPFVDHAAEALAERLGHRPDLITAEALRPALTYLLRFLSNVASPALFERFDQHRTARESQFDRLLRRAEPESAGDRLYQAFVVESHNGGLAGLLARKAVLARQLATAVDDWIEATAELIERLDRDRKAIASLFNGGMPLGSVIELRPGLSDRHHQGRTVAALRFESGLALVYKPKPLAVDRAFFDVLGWINEQGELPPFRRLAVLPGEGYGWMEWVDPEPVADAAGAARYYRRCGRLLALVYALEGYDCHAENVIAAGEQPVLVDLETLMNPTAAGMVDDAALSPATAVAARQLHDSVIRTGFLPNWTLGQDGRWVDVSMLGFSDGQPRFTQAPGWETPNTDGMRRASREVPLPGGQSVPRLPDGAPAGAADEREVIAGFREMYRFLVRHRDELLGAPELLPAWKSLQVRYVPRMTRLYARFLRRLTDPSVLERGIDWSLAAESLARLSIFFSTGETRPGGWDLFAHECAALLRLDIPYFAARGDERHVYDGRGRLLVADRFAETPFERLRTRLDKLGEGDLEMQTGYVRATFQARATGGGVVAHGLGAQRRREEAADVLEPDDALELASRLGHRLASRAIRSPGGAVTWIALEPLQDSAVCSFKPIGYNLHSGSAGVALFLAALARVTGDREVRALALGALREVLAALRDDPQWMVEALGLGANLGVGSILYALSAAGELLDEEDLVRRAATAARGLGHPAIEKDSKLDVVFGAAGAILSLLKLHRASGDAAVLDVAAECGRHLLAHVRETGEGLAACPTMDGALHTGFSHGAAGLACALARLAAATGETTFAAAARGLVAWEENHFDRGEGNYPTHRKRDEAPIFLAAWCHGAPGIALSRLALLEALGEPGALVQAERCLATTERHGLADADHLCCGTSGRIDVLLEAGRRLAQPARIERARRLAAEAVHRAAGSGGCRLPAGTTDAALLPGLFTGSAGIGYTWLRLARPDELPSVLLFD